MVTLCQTTIKEIQYENSIQVMNFTIRRTMLKTSLLKTPNTPSGHNDDITIILTR
jgi:hypothetical protein